MMISKIENNQIFCLYRNRLILMDFGKYLVNIIIDRRNMEKYTLPFTTISNEQKILQIRKKSSSFKKRSVKTWTAQQDQRLISFHQHYPKNWNIISQLMKNRNQNQCLHRFRRISRHQHNKKIWNPREDQTVIKMISQVGYNWRAIAQALQTKSGKQIRQRFLNKLDPRIKHQEWTEQEDMRIILLYTKIGSKWSQISKYLPGRPQNRIKNRFYSYIQKNYNFNVKEGHFNEMMLKKTNQNIEQVSIIKKVAQNKQSATITREKCLNVYSNILNLQEQKIGNEELCQFLKQDLKNFKDKFEKIESEKQKIPNSMKQINQESFQKYQANQNNDLLYFDDD